MKKALLLSLTVPAFTASFASAAGLKLAWNDCLGAGGATNRSFACDTNVGSNDLYVSFDPPADIPDVIGFNPVVDLYEVNHSPMPAWWQLKNAGSCRMLSLTSPNIPGSCDSIWSTQRVPGIAGYYVTAVLPSMSLDLARILGSVSVPPLAAAPAHPGTEYTVMVIRIDNRKTTGLGACAGCQNQICFNLSQLLIITNTSGDITMRSCPGRPYDFCDCPGAPGTSVTWQGSPSPTLNRTWGQLKSLYR